MSKVEVDQVTQQSGTTLTVGGGACKTANIDATTITIGRSGGTVSLASGASQSGFGRTGTVDWDTGNIKTGDFTAVNGNGYFVDTTSGAVIITLPASPSAGDIVGVADYAGTAANNNITINRNSSNFEGGANNGVISTNRQTATIVYVDVTQGWVVVDSNDASFIAPEYIAATVSGACNTLVTAPDCSNYKVATFVNPGTFCVSTAGNPIGADTVQTLIIAGGGGGGKGCSHGSGAGAGGYRTTCATPVTVSAYPITVGGGGAGAPSSSPKFGTQGGTSSAFSRDSAGGGYGSGWNNSGGGPGGSGGGSACGSSPGNFGTGNDPSTAPPQGNPGGPSCGARMGGGGGAGESGNTDGTGLGGDGVASSIDGTPTVRGGGGSGGGSSGGSANLPGGDGGGGTGSGTGAGGNGVAATGGGGGGSYTSQVGGTGGGGVVIIRYRFQ